jgi:hypothetical protein
LPFSVREAPAVEKASPARTSTPVPSLRKEEDPAAAPATNLVFVPPVDATSVEVDLIILSSDSEDEVDWEAHVTGDEVDWEAFAAEDVDDVESVGSWCNTPSVKHALGIANHVHNNHHAFISIIKHP